MQYGQEGIIPSWSQLAEFQGIVFLWITQKSCSADPV